MQTSIDADYLVVGAGAMALAFTDALVDHSDARVVIVDRRNGVGGHWREAYSFVRLHVASSFYGVASTLFGGRLQESGPEAGLHERASQPEVLAYFEGVLARLEATGRVQFLRRSEYADGVVVRLGSGARLAVPANCRVVDAHYLSPTIPAEVPPPFSAEDGVRVVPVNDLVDLEDAPSQYVIVGSGKTATDAIVWLLGKGTDPGSVCWVRPRDPWMFNRERLQPDPAVFLGMAADLWECAEAASSVDDIYLRLEERGVMLRIDRAVAPMMARVPVIARWEIEMLQTVEDVVRLGHVRVGRARPDRSRRGLGGDRGRRGGRPLCRQRPAEPADGVALATQRDHATAGPFGVPVLRRGVDRLRRGDAGRRRGEEPALPAQPLRRHPGRLGRDERARQPQHRGVLGRARHQGMG